MKAVIVMMAAVMMQFVVYSSCKAGNVAQQWMASGVWRNGFTANPFAETDAEVFYEQYQLAPQMWDSIFAWLASIDPVAMEPSKKAMSWSHAYAKVLDQDLRTPEKCQWEQHRRTIDLQWDVTGSERYRLTRHLELLEAKNEYNPKKDVQNFRMNGSPRPGECLLLDSDPQTFYLFFPNDIHEACGIAGEVCTPRKIVVKIDYLEPGTANAHWGAEVDARHDSILSLISGADIVEQSVVSIRQLGAKPMTATTRSDCRPAFVKAMQRAAKQKNGLRVVVPAGDWFVKGPIHLVSHVILELQEGAHLYFSDDTRDYLPMVKTSWEGNFCYNYSPFIYGYGLTDVAIVGRGTIDGNCPNTFPNWRKEQKADQMQLREQCHTDVPYEERKFGEGHLLRPHLIQLYNCSNITLENVLITNSPFWCVHLLCCENIICRGLRYDAKLINNDGIDPEMSRNILIENIEFNNGDDNVAIKAGRDNDGWREARPSENIIIRNCRFKGLHGVVIGSEMSAGVRNVFVENCTYGGYNKRALYVKTNPNRGGFVHDIYFRNCEFGEMEDLFYITSMYAGEGADDNHYTDVHAIHAKDIHAERVNNAAIVLQGTAALPLRDISFERVTVDSCRIGFSATYAPDVRLTDCHLGGRVQSAPSQAAHTDHVFDR